jgi:hypothetical protein
MFGKKEKCDISNFRLSNKVNRLINNTIVRQVQFKCEAKHAKEWCDIE